MWASSTARKNASRLLALQKSKQYDEILEVHQSPKLILAFASIVYTLFSYELSFIE